ncbi:hypothetical protein L1857_18100 [Amycolatopsis thermalba]|uniref:Uncharacterized protein n=1 Tax=Amycolatopsis thermalba TaxID=944492 RepID=A0ABY4NX17_9PSEU|nr:MULTISPECIES: hypothetical protein [Amycolatopsis]OXM72383.1 hypothetical protein CF166_14990 [Amycolatopsis sp. KNN50.9b]UQS24591.1 hypothetical protein L1857_18100 [Amycolatopsis thermalba]
MAGRPSGDPPSTRDAAIARLPDAYAEALRLRDAGVPRARIAARLRVEPQSLDALFAIAEAKLGTLLDDA